VVVAAHRSWLDPACIAAACHRPIHFLILSSVFHRPRSRWFYRWMGGLPVRSGGSESTASLRGAMRLLRDGKLVGVFPEGRVMPEGQLGPLHPGAAMLAARLQVPVIPVAVRGSAQAWPHGKSLPRPAPVSVRIGSPITPPAAVNRAAIEELLRRIESDLHALGEEGSS